MPAALAGEEKNSAYEYYSLLIEHSEQNNSAERSFTISHFQFLTLVAFLVRILLSLLKNFLNASKIVSRMLARKAKVSKFAVKDSIHL